VLSFLTISSGPPASHQRKTVTAAEELGLQCDPRGSRPTRQNLRMKVADGLGLGAPESAGSLRPGVVDLFAEFNLAGLYEIPLCVEAVLGGQMEHRVMHVSRARGDIRAAREREIQFA
jgi:hypothetical protein